MAYLQKDPMENTHSIEPKMPAKAQLFVARQERLIIVSRSNTEANFNSTGFHRLGQLSLNFSHEPHVKANEVIAFKNMPAQLL